MSLDPHPYLDAAAALLTQHGKESVIGPTLGARPGIRVLRVDGYDTDRLGTFTRDVPRAGTRLEAARAKALLAMEISGLPLGLGSEGSFGPDPYLGTSAWNVEVIAWVDAQRGLEVMATASGPETNYRQGWVDEWESVETFAKAAGFPAHGLVISAGPQDAPLAKGLTDLHALAHAFAVARTRHGRAWIETDMRAHLNPTRMAMIARAADQLASRLDSRCPRCGTPGWWASGAVPGRPCAECGEPTRLAVAERWACGACGLQEHRPVEAGPADPGSCDACNP